ncbi:Vwa8 [Symbiodinium sp. CCMP2592]|nr:Vwa8 [Symbiodinium sp. CCMP2592]
MFDWDEVPDDIADYVAVEQPDSDREEPATPQLCPVRESDGPGPGCRLELGGVFLEKDLAEASTISALVPSISEEAPEPTQAELETLRWMMQKVSMNQDMFLLGPPGPRVRHLVYHFCALFDRQVEYVGINSDTSEADLKQRREICDGHVVYVDQPPVRAALHGRILVLEGIEKAERNVLPLLNNLLENREMQLEDGRFLSRMATGKCEGRGTIKDCEMVRVSPDFLVIAIGMPCRGNPLDPPLRSRFASHNIYKRRAAEAVQDASRRVPGATDAILKKVKDVLEEVESNAIKFKNKGSPIPMTMPDSAASSMLRVMELFPNVSALATMRRSYPLDLVHAATEGAASGTGRKEASRYLVETVRKSKEPCMATVTFREETLSKLQDVAAPAGNWQVEEAGPGSLRLTPTQKRLVGAMMQDHAAGMDICLVGEKGVGKSALVRAFSEQLGFRRRVIFCFKDLLARDLLQRRTTDQAGQTQWQDSALVQAAIHGDIAVLDGLHRLAHGHVAILGPLLVDREAVLPDGSRLVSPERWRKLSVAKGLCQDCREFEEAHVRFRAVHPSFRCVATAESQTSQREGRQNLWLDDEVVTLFQFHSLAPLPAQEQVQLANRSRVSKNDQVFEGLIMFGEKMRSASLEDPGLEPLRMTLRILLRIAVHLDKRPGDVVGAMSRVFSACLDFLPPSSQEAVHRILQAALKESGVPIKQWVPHALMADADSRKRRQELRELENMAIQARMFGGGQEVDEAREKAESDREQQRRARLESLRKQGEASLLRKPVEAARVANGILKIGDVSCPMRVPARPELVPDVAFVDIPQHVDILKGMLLDWSLGHHLLLVGNQGVGKNKLTDRLLGLLQCEREYIQLHRDTTVQSLTLAPSLSSGVVVWEDSPLLRAVKAGRCLVVDEADKAPLEVVCVLKALSEDGELSLPDGRTVVRENDARFAEAADEVVKMSSDFRLLVLANRPGYPFMGNDLFKVCGDVFSCHVVDNPDIASEVELLKSVGPDVPKNQIIQLSLLFAELRELVASGQLAYPYSTRELVKLVSHAQRFPRDSLEEVAAGVFAFDIADTKKRKPLLEVLQRHGIATTEVGVRLLEGRKNQGNMTLRLDENRDKSKDVTNQDNPDGQRPPDMAEAGPKHGEWDGQQHIGGNRFAGGSGGTGTAGLGGRWGPYRLDVGQKLVQVSEDKKHGLDEATKRKAQQMADEAYQKRLAEMKMSLKEGEAYAALRGQVATQIQEMKVCLESQAARQHERQWLKNQTMGELDESRLVDGITGCKTVYMRRGDPEGQMFGKSQQHPKRLTFVMDISGSMYTFNRIDRRLQRLQEVAAFIFESFTGFEDKYDYRMVGHSGTGPEAERLVEWGRPPFSDRERLEICKSMEAHAQFCYPGDHTLEATARAIAELGRQSADERFLLVVSDADLQRYNIDIRRWNQILHQDPTIKAYVILISNNVDEAERIKSTLAPGRAHICAETASLAVTFKQIFKDSMLRDA